MVKRATPRKVPALADYLTAVMMIALALDGEDVAQGLHVMLQRRQRRLKLRQRGSRGDTCVWVGRGKVPSATMRRQPYSGTRVQR